jgi:hypothetical protein
MVFFAIALVLLLASFAVLVWKLASRFDARQCTAEWLDTFSLKTYAPMERLLDKHDFVFLASQPGYRPGMEKRVLAERRKIFRAYLRLLVRDFNQLIGIGKLMVVYSNRDQQEFARSLWRQQVRFYARFFALQVQLALYPWGWPAVDAGSLLASLGAMRTKVGELTSTGPVLTRWA